MKKIIIFLAIILLIAGVGFFVLNMGDGEVKTNTGKTTKEVEKEKSYKLHFENVELTPGAVFDENKIDKPGTKSVIPSCAFQGEDNVYTFDFGEITTHVDDGKEIIYSVYFLDDSIQTDEGIKLSDDFSKVKDVYGNSNLSEDNRYSYKSSNVKLSFDVNNDVVIGIEYTLE